MGCGVSEGLFKLVFCMRECCVWCVCPCYYCRLCGAVGVVSFMCIGRVACVIGDLCHVVVCLSFFVLFVVIVSQVSLCLS